MVTNTAPTVDIETEILTPEARDLLNPPTTSKAVVSVNSKRFRIPADVVAQACEHLPDEQRSALKWLHRYCKEKDFDKDEIARLLKKPNGDYYSYDSIYQTLTGKRSEQGASLDNLVAAIDSLRRIAEQREGMVTNGFIETRLSKRIFQHCRQSLLRRKIGIVVGDSHIGKSTALQEYQRLNNHGETIYMDFPSINGVWPFLVALCRALGLSEQMRRQDVRRRIFDTIDDRMLIIIDNLHRAFRGSAAKGLQVFDFIQELYDAKRPGIVFSMTNEGRTELESGAHKKRLEQIWRRRLGQPLQLPNVTPDDDLDLFAAAYGLPAAPDEVIEISSRVRGPRGNIVTRTHKDNPYRLQTDINRKEGLSVWVSILQSGSDLALAAKKPITWGAVISAYCQSQADAAPIS